MPSDSFTGSRAFDAQGARVGVVTCLRCGAAILLDPADLFDPALLHEQWHAEQDAA